MRIAVTGSTGFLGTSLCKALATRGNEVFGIHSRNVDLTRQTSLESLGVGSYDVIYHLAAWTQAGDFCLRHPGEQWIINQQINTNVLSWWAAHQPRAKLVVMGTSCAYAPGSVHAEPDYMRGEPISGLYTYAMTKRMLFEGARALGSQFGLRYLCAVPSTLYGPGYHTDGRQMHFIFDLIRKVIRGKELGEPVILWGDGHQRRELVFVDDFVRTLIELEPLVQDDLVNVGAGEDHSIGDFAAVICGIVGFDLGRIEYDTSRYVGAAAKLLSISKLRGILPNYAPRRLEDGLRQTIGWFYETRAYLK